MQPFLNPVQLYLNDKSSVSSKTGFLGPYKVKLYIYVFSFYKQTLLVWLGVRIIKHFIYVYVADNIGFLGNTNTISVYKIENVNFVQNCAAI